MGSATIGVPEQMRRTFAEEEVSAFFTSFCWLLQAEGSSSGSGRVSGQTHKLRTASTKEVFQPHIRLHQNRARLDKCMVSGAPKP